MKTSVKANYRDVMVEIEDFPFIVKRGKKIYVEKDFGHKLISQLYTGAAFPVSKTGFFTFLPFRCSKCSSKLPGKTDGNALFKGAMDVSGHSIRISVQAKSVLCPQCGLKQLDANLENSNSINEALAIAINHQGITP